MSDSKKSTDEENFKLSTSNQRFRELPFLKMSEEQIISMLEYFDSSLACSNILTSINSENPQILLNVIHDRINDISLLVSICHGLLHSNQSLEKKIQNFESKFNNNCDLKEKSNEDKLFSDEFSTNQSQILPMHASNTTSLKQKIDDAYLQNSNIVNEMFQLSRTRDSCEHYEKSLVDKIIFELIAKRQETSSMTEQISQFLTEFIGQQTEITSLIIENFNLQEKYNKVLKSKKKLKSRLKNMVKEMSVRENDILLLKNQQKENKQLFKRPKFSNISMENNNNFDSDINEQNFTSFPSCLDGISTFGVVKDIECLSDKISAKSRSTNSITDGESGKLSTRVVKDESGKQRVQFVKTSHNSNFMKIWRNLDESHKNEGLNQILKENNRTPVESLTTNQDKSSFASDTTSNRANEYNYSLPFVSSHNEKLPPDLCPTTDFNKSNDLQHKLNNQNAFPWENEKLKPAYQIDSVGKTFDKFCVMPQKTIHSLSSLPSDPPESNSQTSSIFGTLKKFFS